MGQTGHQKAHATGMAAEFHAMEILYRLGHEPAITLGNAKSIDILTKTKCGKIFAISVKAMTAGGKWPLGSLSLKDLIDRDKDMIFILFYYKKFADLMAIPDTWIIPASKLAWFNQKTEAIETLKPLRGWEKGAKAIYFYKKDNDQKELSPFQNNWDPLKCGCLICNQDKK